ncbi:MAG TPA: hypothetical protein VMR98_04075 [Candidatus Polarisedimenticolaceae bacterium]|nr:hypothetical protein [Candidatus Polarisedimenticolaceae bacterium]
MRVFLAYLDPGSGSIIWQAIIGGAIGGAYVLRNTAGRIVEAGRAAFGSRSQDPEDKTDSDTKQ